jgi:hypothetical protein
MDFQHIILDEGDGVARLMLNKPPLNVMDIAMLREAGLICEMPGCKAYLIISTQSKA